MKKVIREKQEVEPEPTLTRVGDIKDNHNNWWICDKCKLLYSPDDKILYRQEWHGGLAQHKCPKCEQSVLSGSYDYFQSHYELQD